MTIPPNNRVDPTADLHFRLTRCVGRLWSAVVHPQRSVQHTSHHPRARSSWGPEGPRHASPGQASPASVALGQRPQDTPEPCRGEPGSRSYTALRSARGLSRPLGASGCFLGRSTQGGAPRGLGACPGLACLAPLGLRAPNQPRQPRPGGRLGFNRAPVVQRGCTLR